MKEIILTQGKIAFVDDDIYELIKNYKWYAHKDHNTFYVTRNTSRKDDPQGKQYKIILHHFIMGKPSKGFEIDHIDGNGLNNQRDNLRIVTKRGNHQNQSMHRKGKLVGPTYHKRDKIWESQININGKNTYLGRFKTELEAHQAYLEALKKYESKSNL